MPVLEAMASGLPIVMSKKDGKEIVDDAVLLIENDPKKVQIIFEKILSEDDFKKELIQKGLNKIKEIDSKKMEQKEIELYEKLIKTNN